LKILKRGKKYISPPQRMDGVMIPSALIGYRVFERHTKEEARNRRRLLLVDGHSSYVNMAFLNKADKLKILLMVLPPHSTHRLQPLDVGLFQPLSIAYSQHLNDSIYGSLSWCRMTKQSFWVVFKAAWEDSFTEKNILRAFETTGIFPLDSGKTLTVIQKKPDIKEPEVQGTPLTCREIRGIQRELQYGTPRKADKAVRTLSRVAYKLAAMLEVQQHITRGLTKALDFEKKRRQRPKKLNLLREESAGPIFFSPSKIQRAKAIQVAKDVEAQQKKGLQAEKKVQQAARKQEKEREKAERATLQENRRRRCRRQRHNKQQRFRRVRSYERPKRLISS
jgi:DDE superfamily endonuclease